MNEVLIIFLSSWRNFCKKWKNRSRKNPSLESLEELFIFRNDQLRRKLATVIFIVLKVLNLLSSKFNISGLLLKSVKCLNNL